MTHWIDELKQVFDFPEILSVGLMGIYSCEDMKIAGHNTDWMDRARPDDLDKMVREIRTCVDQEHKICKAFNLIGFILAYSIKKE